MKKLFLLLCISYNCSALEMGLEFDVNEGKKLREIREQVPESPVWGANRSKVEEIDEQNEWDILRIAAKREVLEEVGLDLKDDLKYITNNYFVGSSNVAAHVIDTIFHCKIEKTNLAINASAREVPEYYWLTEEEINKAHNAPQWLKKSVQYIRRTP